MALTGEVTEVFVSEVEGKPSVLIVDYKGKPWKMSTFLPEIKSVLKDLQQGDIVEFETRKSGKYTNLSEVHKVGEGGQPTTGMKPSPAPTMKKSTGNVDQIAFNMVAASISGGAQVPEYSDFNELFNQYRNWVKKALAGDDVPF